MTGATRRPRAAADTRELPEVLRSQLIAGIISTGLAQLAEQHDGQEARALAEVFRTTATEILDWHIAAERNGAV
jgi:hypothetical protein